MFLAGNEAIRDAVVPNSVRLSHHFYVWFFSVYANPLCLYPDCKAAFSVHYAVK